MTTVALPLVRTSAAAPATIVAVSSSNPDGTYKVGDKIQITITFSAPVTIDGGLALLLETGPSDRAIRSEYRSETRSVASLKFEYEVQVGDRSFDLDYQSKTAILEGPTKVTSNGVDADLTLPDPGKPGSLGAAHNIVIDGSGIDEQFQSPIGSIRGLHGIAMIEDIRENISTLGFGLGDKGPCTSPNDEHCVGKDLGYRAVLERCSNEAQLNCLESVTGGIGAEAQQLGKFDQLFPKRGANDFVGDPKANLPNGSTPSIFRFPDLPHSTINGVKYDTYAVTVSVTGSYLNGRVLTQEGLFASITPIVIRESTCDERFNGGKGDGKACLDTYNGGVAVDQDGGYRCILWDTIDGNGDKKIWAQDPSTGDKSLCALKRPFPKGVTFTIKARLSAQPKGWLHGRLEDPSVVFGNSKGKTAVTISGGPVKVPVLSAVGDYEVLPKAIQEYFDALCERNCKSPRFPEPQTPATPKDQRLLQLNPPSSSSTSFKEMALWRDFIGDSAAAVPGHWNLRTLSGEEMGRASSCISSKSGVTGIVTTNATAYFEGPPAFDSTSKTLKYEVAAPHFENDGKTEFKGSYNLIVREDVAECMYGFSNAFAAPAPPEEFADESDPDVYVEEEPYTDEDIYAEEYPEFEEEFVDTDDGSYEMFEDVEYEEIPLDEYVEEEEDFTLTEDVSDSGEVIEEEQVFEETVVASIDAQILTELQKAATANTAIELAGGWFKFSATNFTFSKPTVKVKFAATPSKVLACIAGSTVKYVKSIRSQCPTGTSIAKTAYCVKGKTVDAIVGASPKCPKGTKVAKTLKCAKGDDARLVVAVAPKCAKGWSKVSTYICVKGNIARSVSAVQVKCANGFELAKQVSCVKGRMLTTVTAVKPTCPKGYRVKKK